MKKISLSDINLLDVGNTIGLTGTIWTSNEGVSYITLLPQTSEEELGELQILKMTLEDWGKFIRQTDILETKILAEDKGSIKKVIVRKTARLIDTHMQWRVFRRDNYTCRYTGETGIPLTVDHVDLWENGGATIEENLISCSRKANKLRGNIPYEQWINSNEYKRISQNLPEDIKQANRNVVNTLDSLRAKRVTIIRSR
jgi:hypothetical protein